MLREIGQQPEALEQTLRAEESHMQRVASSLRKSGVRLIVLVARGTSDNAALFGRYLLELTTGIPVSLAAPSIHTLYKRSLNLRDALVVGVSQSGEATDINVVLESCKDSCTRVLAITNNRNSTMASIAHETFITRAGAERSVAATKTYTTQLMVFHMLARALRGESFEPLRAIPDYAEKTYGLVGYIDSVIERYRFMDHCVVVGRGLNYASAFEFALKLMETCYVVAERFSSADFLHGPIAVLQRDFPIMFLAPPGPVFGDMRKLAARTKQLQADSLIISSEKSILKLASCPIQMPERIPDLYSPIPYIIPGQILAAMLADVKGLSPDKPRGLSKITQTL
jgi:glutamine---fructose-6-phosphate transaminase (isomerizing)